MSHVEDRWYKTVPGPDGKPVKEPRARCNAGKRWRVRYETPDGDERSRSFDKKGTAEAFKIEVDAALQRGTYIDPDAGRVSLRRHVWSWAEAQSWDANTRQNYEQRIRNHIEPGLGKKTLAQLAASPSTITAWLKGRPVSARYAAQILDTLSACLDAAVDDGLIARNPCRVASVKRPRADRRKVTPWTGGQVASAQAGMPDRYQAMADVGAGLGLRQGEILGLPVTAVEFLRKRVYVRVQVRRIGGRLVFAPPKGGKERHVPMPQAVSLALAAHIERFPAREVTLPWKDPDGKPRTERLVFTNTHGRALGSNYVNSSIWRPARIAAGLPDTRDNGMHALRHRYASVLLAGGVDINRLSAYLGHASAAFTLSVYCHLMPSDDDQALRAVESALAIEAPSDNRHNAEHG